MDVDAMDETLDFINYFDLTPQYFPWREPIPEQINIRRAKMTDLLIFDILLRSGGIASSEDLYPPPDVPALERLLDAIEGSTYDTLKKDCLVYFLLKWHMDGREERFQQERCIPPQFSSLADAYWHLDTGVNVAKGVSILSDARLNRDYASKILEAISLSEDPYRLVLKYVRTAKPPLTEPNDLELYTTALVESSLLEGWQFQRSFSEGHFIRPRLFHKILEWCLSPKPRPQLAQLVSFPFSTYEESLLHAYALNPPPSCPPASLPVIQDLVCVRLIQSGQYGSAIKLDRQFAAFMTKVSAKAQATIDNRRQMMDEIMGVMPAVERALLEAELAQGIQPSGSGESWASGTMSSNDLSMSWEDVSHPPASTALPQPTKGATQKAPLTAERLGAPRFVGPRSSVPGDNTPLGTATSRKLFAPAPRSLAAQPNLPAHLSSSVPPLFAGIGSKSGLPDTIRVLTPQLGQPLSQFPQGRFGQIPITAPPNTAAPPIFNSANASRNAFYVPPTTNGFKRSLAQDDVRTPPREPSPESLPSPTHDNNDIDMDSEEDRREDHKTNGNGSAAQAEQLTFSVFSQTSSHGQPSKSNGASKPQRVEAQVKAPPGAFLSESEGSEAEVRTASKGRRRGVSPVQQPKQPRASRVQRGVKKVDLGRSLPGSLISDDEKDPEDVGPLPPPLSKQSSRRPRASRDNRRDAEAAESKPPRRSTRLSTALSSQSPEPSPKKTSSKTRTSTRVSTGGPKTAARKKRS